MTDDDGLRHKRKSPTSFKRGEVGARSMCGRYGYVFHQWAKVNCAACLRVRKVKR